MRLKVVEGYGCSRLTRRFKDERPGLHEAGRATELYANKSIDQNPLHPLFN